MVKIRESAGLMEVLEIAAMKIQKKNEASWEIASIRTHKFHPEFPQDGLNA